MVLQGGIQAQLAREAKAFVDLPLPEEAVVLVQDPGSCAEAASRLQGVPVLGVDAEWQPSLTAARPLPSILQVHSITWHAGRE